jgi:hypothetical protein
VNGAASALREALLARVAADEALRGATSVREDVERSQRAIERTRARLHDPS